jgi:hypothetical protein
MPQYSRDCGSIGLRFKLCGFWILKFLNDYEVLTAGLRRVLSPGTQWSCSPLKVDRRFGGTYCLHIHGQRSIQARIQDEAHRKQSPQICSSENSIHFQRITQRYVSEGWCEMDASLGVSQLKQWFPGLPGKRFKTTLSPFKASSLQKSLLRLRILKLYILVCALFMIQYIQDIFMFKNEIFLSFIRIALRTQNIWPRKRNPLPPPLQWNNVS